MTELLVRGASHLWTGSRGGAMRASDGVAVRIRGGVITAIALQRAVRGLH